MNIFNALLVALDGLKTNKVRSALTILGVVIGVAAIIGVMSIGQGAQSLILSQISSLGSGNLFIEPGAWSERMERGTMMQSMLEEAEIKTLKYNDALAIEKLSLIKKTLPVTMGVDRIIYESESKKTTFIGVNANASDIFDLPSVSGRNIDDGDVKSMARVVVLGSKTRQELFGEDDPIGKTIRIKKTNFRVIGALEEKGPQAFMSADESIYLPITTAQKLLLGSNHIQMIIAKVWDENFIDEAITDIRLLLRQRHNIYNPEADPAKDDFKVVSQKETIEMLSSITGILTTLLSSVAAISLLVGGIGIMNIMLVSVTERTREIGLRKAVGATRKDILNQFLLEAIILTFSGGVIGILFGALISLGASLIFDYMLETSWGFLLPMNAVILGVGVSMAIGLVFGIYPARKASRLNPIEALRYE